MADYEPFECMMTHSTCYKQTEKMKVLGVLWHSTGANNWWLKRYVQPYAGDPGYDEKIKKLGKNSNGNDWNHITKNAGLNAWIGKFADKTVGTVQAMPWDYRPWGCGSIRYWNAKKKKYEYGPSCNDGWIQFEICEEYLIEKCPDVWVHYKDTPGDREYAQLVWDEAVKFTAFIFKKYNIDPYGIVKKKDYYGNVKSVPTLLDHRTSHELGFGSNHGDVQHWFSIVLGKDMADARNEVYKAMQEKTAGWVKVGSDWYFYDLDGNMVKSDWVKWKSKWYYLGPDGVMLTGWQKIDGQKYYLYTGNDGHMASYEWIDDLWLEKSGEQKYPYRGMWKENEIGKWYEDESGWYPRDRVMKIDKVEYQFDKKGYLVE